MRFREILTGLAAGIVLASAGYVRAEFIESWNSVDLKENDWRQQAKSVGIVATGWKATGGYDGGRIHSDLAQVSYGTGSNAYYPAFLGSYDDPANGREVDFSGMTVSVRAKDLGGVDLEAGTLHFYVARWISEDDHVCYHYNDSITIGDGTWDYNEIKIVENGDAQKWTNLVNTGTSPPTLSDLLDKPQQFGFLIAGASSSTPPHGTLGFDDFSVTPEPSTLAGLTGMAFVGLLIAWRKRRRRPVAG